MFFFVVKIIVDHGFVCTEMKTHAVYYKFVSTPHTAIAITTEEQSIENKRILCAFITLIQIKKEVNSILKRRYSTI